MLCVRFSYFICNAPIVVLECLASSFDYDVLCSNTLQYLLAIGYSETRRNDEEIRIRNIQIQHQGCRQSLIFQTVAL